jgi:hypothetical protein
MKPRTAKKFISQKAAELGHMSPAFRQFFGIPETGKWKAKLIRRICKYGIEGLFGKGEVVAQKQTAQSKRRKKVLSHFGGRNYDAYIKSNVWRARRNAIMNLHSHQCWITGQKADHVHHITYAHVCQEKVNELMPLCKTVHDLIHLAPGRNAYEKTCNHLGRSAVENFQREFAGLTWEGLLDLAESDAQF